MSSFKALSWKHSNQKRTIISLDYSALLKKFQHAALKDKPIILQSNLPHKSCYWLLTTKHSFQNYARNPTRVSIILLSLPIYKHLKLLSNLHSSLYLPVSKKTIISLYNYIFQKLWHPMVLSLCIKWARSYYFRKFCH